MSLVTFDSVGSQVEKIVVAADHLLDDHEEEPLLLPAGEEFGVGAFSRFQLREDDPGLQTDGERHLLYDDTASSPLFTSSVKWRISSFTALERK